MELSLAFAYVIKTSCYFIIYIRKLNLITQYLKFKAGFSGPLCQFSGGVCANNPCQNGGTCYPLVGGALGYTCQCLPGYSGINCQFRNIQKLNETMLKNPYRSESNKGLTRFFIKNLMKIIFSKDSIIYLNELVIVS